jgi:hypothetical protein
MERREYYIFVMWGKTYTRKSKPAEGRSVAARDQVDSELVARNRV